MPCQQCPSHRRGRHIVWSFDAISSRSRARQCPCCRRRRGGDWHRIRAPEGRCAREHFEEARLSRFIDLREGDLRDTLKRIDGSVDFMLVDIWIPMARPALELVAPHLRPGAIVVCDNTAQYRSEYADYLGFLSDPTNGFLTMTLPFPGGLEFSVRCHA